MIRRHAGDDAILAVIGVSINEVDDGDEEGVGRPSATETTNVKQGRYSEGSYAGPIGLASSLERLGRNARLDLLKILQRCSEDPAVLYETHRRELGVHPCSLSKLSDEGVLRGVLGR